MDWNGKLFIGIYAPLMSFQSNYIFPLGTQFTRYRDARIVSSDKKNLQLNTYRKFIHFELSSLFSCFVFVIVSFLCLKWRLYNG